MLFVLVEPLVAVLHEELVLSEGGIDEAVDEGRGQVLAGRVHLAAAKGRTRIVVQVRLVNVLGRLGLHDVELAGQCQEVAVEVRVGHDLDEIVVVLELLAELEKDLLAAQHESQLLPHDAVLAAEERLLHQRVVVDLQSQPQGLGPLVELAENGKRRLEQVDVLRVGDVGDAAAQVEADSIVGHLVHVALEQLQLLDLHEQVARLGLGVVRHLVGDDLFDQVLQLGPFLADFVALGGDLVPLLGDLAGQVPDILVAPLHQTLLRADQSVLEAFGAFVVGHGQHRNNVGAQGLGLAFRHLFKHFD